MKALGIRHLAFSHTIARLMIAVAALTLCMLVAPTAEAKPAQGTSSGSGALTVASSRAAYNDYAGTIDLYVNNTYANYDITGDGKADKIRLKTLGTITTPGWPSGEEGLAVYVNGKKALTLSKKAFSTANDGYVLQLATLKNGKVFFYVRSKWHNQLDTTNRLYRYKGGKLVLAKDLIKIADSRDGLKNGGTVARSYGLRGPNGIAVSGNKIVAKGMLANSLVVSGSFDIKLAYSKGTLVLSPRITKLELGFYGETAKPLVAKRSITVYKSATGSKKAFAIKKGQKVTVKKISLRNKDPRVQVKVGKKTGWIKLVRDVSTIWSYSTTGGGHKYFENVMAVG